MPLTVTCGCGKRFAAPDHLAGRTVACPQCRQPLKIVGAASAQATASAVPAAAVPATGAAGLIKVACGCGKAFAAPPGMAGQRVACPVCGQALQIPAPGAAGQAPATRPPAPPTAGALDDLLSEAGLTASRTGRRCPECGSDMAAEAIVCIECGFNENLGRKMQTKRWTRGL